MSEDCSGGVGEPMLCGMPASFINALLPEILPEGKAKTEAVVGHQGGEYVPFEPPDFGVSKYQIEWSDEDQAFVATVPSGVVEGDPYEYFCGIDPHPVAALTILREAMFVAAPTIKEMEQEKQSGASSSVG